MVRDTVCPRYCPGSPVGLDPARALSLSGSWCWASTKRTAVGALEDESLASTAFCWSRNQSTQIWGQEWKGTACFLTGHSGAVEVQVGMLGQLFLRSQFSAFQGR